MPVRKSWDILSRMHPHDRDKLISFEETEHRYTINGSSTGWRSVSQILSRFHDPFEPDKAADAVMKSSKFKKGSHPLSGRTKEQIVEYWDKENKKGTALHARMERSMNQKYHLNLRSPRHSSGELILEKVEAKFIKNVVSANTADLDGESKYETRMILLSNKNWEAYTFDSADEFGDLSGTFLGYYWKDKTVRRNPKNDSELGDDEPVLSYTEAILETKQVHAFWEKYSYLEPFRSEWVVWDEDWHIAGTIDAVVKDIRDDTYWILDWKRVRTGLEADLEATRWGYIQEDDEWLEPVKFWAKKMPAPMDDLYNTKYWNYSLQLNLYRAILEKNYGVHISGMMLVQFHPELGETCNVHKVMRLNEHVERLVKMEE